MASGSLETPIVTRSPKSKPDIVGIFEQLEKSNVPAGYFVGMSSVHFTKLHGCHGDYLDGKMRVSTDSASLAMVNSVIVHELAHHLDDMFCISKDASLREEKRTSSQHMPDGYARSSFSEYLACGFEVYYFGSDKDKKKMRKMNPCLHRTIRHIHRRYSDFTRKNAIMMPIYDVQRP